MIIQIETGGVWLRQPPWSFSSSRGQSEIVRLTAISSKDKDLSKMKTMDLTWPAWLLQLRSLGKDACWHCFNLICDIKHMEQGKKESSCSLQWHKLPLLQKKDTTDRGIWGARTKYTITLYTNIRKFVENGLNYSLPCSSSSSFCHLPARGFWDGVGKVQKDLQVDVLEKGLGTGKCLKNSTFLTSS